MKITATKTYKFSVPTGHDAGELTSNSSKTWLFCKIETDVGLSGWVEWSRGGSLRGMALPQQKEFG